MRFIADAMLGSLARRMRLLGFDVHYDPALPDNEVLRLALEQDRIILTRDTGLSSRPLAERHLLILSDHLEAQLAQVLEAFPAPAGGVLTRCSVCNGPLYALDRTEARDLVPDHVLATAGEYWRCSGCGKVYWKGSHVRNMEMRCQKE